MLTFIILYNNLIPISLIVTMEVVKFQQAQLINSDLDMYYAKSDTPAVCRTSSLVEDLGQIEYVFSDKTGTLTRNEMEFRCCSIGGVAYADVVDETKREGSGFKADGSEEGAGGWKTFSEMSTFLQEGSNPFVDAGGNVDGRGREREVLREFLTLLAVCHTVIPEVKDEKMVFQASSPDEAALVAGAELLGFQFYVRRRPPFFPFL
jgi:phospholipid-transporting ATPase